MGFFSWKTSDTEESIWNSFTTKCRPVYLYCPNGEIIEEKEYEGYVVFGGLDAYGLLAMWNREVEGAEPMFSYSEPDPAFIEYIESVRDAGISLAFSGKEIKFPLKFSFSKNRSYPALAAAQDCPNQGYFGCEWEEEEEDDWEESEDDDFEEGLDD